MRSPKENIEKPKQTYAPPPSFFSTPEGKIDRANRRAKSFSDSTSKIFQKFGHMPVNNHPTEIRDEIDNLPTNLKSMNDLCSDLSKYKNLWWREMHKLLMKQKSMLSETKPPSVTSENELEKDSKKIFKEFMDSTEKAISSVLKSAKKLRYNNTWWKATVFIFDKIRILLHSFIKFTILPFAHFVQRQIKKNSFLFEENSKVRAASRTSVQSNDPVYYKGKKFFNYINKLENIKPLGSRIEELQNAFSKNNSLYYLPKDFEANNLVAVSENSDLNSGFFPTRQFL